jgi:hypothetical protein
MSSSNIIDSHLAIVAQLLIVLFVGMHVGYANPSSAPYLETSTGGISTWIGPNKDAYIVGSDIQLMIAVHQANGQVVQLESPEQRILHITDIQFEVRTEDNISHPDWLAKMQLRPYLTDMETYSDSLWQKSGIIPWNRNEIHNFILTIPAEAAGHTISLSAVYNHPKFGKIETRNSEAVSVIAPRTSTDYDLVRTTQLRMAELAQDNQRVIMLADSFINDGFTGLRGLVIARSSAQRAQRYDAALRYLDLCMATNGTFTIPRGNDFGLTPPFDNSENARRERAAVNQAEYQRVRTDYCAKIQEQQEQQR